MCLDWPVTELASLDSMLACGDVREARLSQPIGSRKPV